MSSVIETIERAQLRRVPSLAPGDRVKVHFQVIEGSRRRVQIFEGVVIKRQGHGARETSPCAKQSVGVGVERSFPVHSPKIERIELAARGDVRRAKLYYLSDRVGKRARVRERRYIGPEETVEPGLIHEIPEATDADGMTPADGQRGRTPGRPRRRGNGHRCSERAEDSPAADASSAPDAQAAADAQAAPDASADAANAAADTSRPPSLRCSTTPASDAGVPPRPLRYHGNAEEAPTGDEPA